MLHRILSILLIGTTLLGSSFCCCTLKVQAAEQAETPSCCCQKSESQKPCPANSDDNEPHKCPCRDQHAIGATLDVHQIILTSPSVKWMSDLWDVCPQDCGFKMNEVSLQEMPLPHGSAESRLSGTALLIAHCVRRC